MARVNIVGIGPGNGLSLTGEAVQAIAESSCLIGDRRVTAPYEDIGKTILYTSDANAIQGYLEEAEDKSIISILVSGDIGFYSLAKRLLEEENRGLHDINLICGISSLQYFCAKLKTSWDDVLTVSLHGRDIPIVNKVMTSRKVFLLTGGKNSPGEICKTLCYHGLGTVQVCVGENLSYPNEKVTVDRAENLAAQLFSPLAVMLIINDRPTRVPGITHGLSDDRFIRGDAPMTKQEIRAVSISKLQLQTTDIVYDIGAGTGSVAVEVALQAACGFVYAIEKDSDALTLIHRNIEKFGTANLFVIPTEAPEGLANLPKPDKVFIGGHGGNLSKILDCILDKNPQVRIVINAITLETVHEAVTYFNHLPDMEAEIVTITVSKAKKMGAYHLMMGQNPITIITAQRMI